MQHADSAWLSAPVATGEKCGKHACPRAEELGPLFMLSPHIRGSKESGPRFEISVLFQ
jgi:hypothetical protein